MMTHHEFANRLERLYLQIVRVRLHNLIWQQIWPTPEVGDAFQAYSGFFRLTLRAHMDMAILGMAKVFDRDKRTASLAVLTNVALEDRSLVPYAKPGSLEGLRDRIDSNRGLLERIRRVRNKRIAHIEVRFSPLPQVLKGEFDTLLQSVMENLKELYTAHRRTTPQWTVIGLGNERDASGVLETLTAHLLEEQSQLNEFICRDIAPSKGEVG